MVASYYTNTKYLITICTEPQWRWTPLRKSKENKGSFPFQSITKKKKNADNLV